MTQRWRIFSAFALLYILAYFYRIALAVMAKDLAAEAHLSAAQLGTLSGAFFYAFALTQIPLGPLLDRFGGKKVALCCGIITTIGLVLFTAASSYPALLAGRILLGIGSGSVLMSALRTFTHWFDMKEFGKVSGFIIAVGNLGNIAGTAPFAWAMTSVGWRLTFWVVALLQLIVLLIVWIFVQETPEKSPERVRHQSLSESFGKVIREKTYWYLVLIAFFWYAGYMAVQGLWGGPYLQDVAGLSRQAASACLFASSLGFLVGSTQVGRFAELLHSQQKVMLRGETLLCVCLLYFILPPLHLPMITLVGLFFILGLAVSSGVAIYPLIRERFPHEIIGTALTSVNLFILLGAAAMQQVMGWVINQYPSVNAAYPAEAYRTAFSIPVAGLLVALLLFSRLPVKDHSEGTR